MKIAINLCQYSFKKFYLFLIYYFSTPDFPWILWDGNLFKFYGPVLS